jgi:putative ABC transport system substrate-binding protein
VKRREFITLLGGAAAAWPLGARAQQGERVRRIGVITGGPRPDDQDVRANIAAFLEGLQKFGWADGRNVRIDYRWGLGQTDTIRKQVEELVALAPEVILSSGTASLAPLLQATSAVPIVFVNVADPVGGGFIESLSRPGGNATGFMQFEYDLSGKWLELLKQITPNVTRAAVVASENSDSRVTMV